MQSILMALQKTNSRYLHSIQDDVLYEKKTVNLCDSTEFDVQSYSIEVTHQSGIDFSKRNALKTFTQVILYA